MDFMLVQKDVWEICQFLKDAASQGSMATYLRVEMRQKVQQAISIWLHQELLNDLKFKGRMKKGGNNDIG